MTVTPSPTKTDLAFTQEQQDLRSTVRQFLEHHSSESAVRRAMETSEGYDPQVWKRLSVQLGLTSLAIPEEFGGAGGGAVETGIVFEEMGRALFCGPYFSSVAMAANLLLALGDRTAMTKYLPGIADGSLLVAVAIAEDSAQWGAGSVTLTARSTGSGWRLDGRKMFVLDGALADLVLVVARTGDGPSVFAVPGDAPGLARREMSTIDLTRRQAGLELADVPAELVGEDGAAGPAVEHMLDCVAVALAAEQVGGASRAMEMAREYACTREQFGRPIGTFQAIKHRCADMLVQVESARSLAYYAMWALADGAQDGPLAASIAKAYCSDAFAWVVAENIQVHGGIGFTWEHPAHLYFKRAQTSRVLFGDPAHHRELAAQRLGL
ncbi:acyl-CoA dehydrogenase family protein [Sporichthya brevicatena]|uniref:Acyl-CoA dehydrogenase family protein n=1 Tax=Sporichthya brevicatena TaxID=171442 RepID=A0ABN1HAV8_9ACTN